MRIQRQSNPDRTQDGPRQPVPAPVSAAVQRVLASGGQMTPQQTLALQRMAGNTAVAQRLVNGNDQEQHQHSGQCGHTPAVQRSTVPDVVNSPGQPFDGPLRTEMETRFGADLSHLRVHTDAAAQRSATEIQAEAYTSGNHMVFTPASIRNPMVVAHEIAHTFDQARGSVPGTDQGNGLKMSSPDDSGERSAEAKAREVMGRPVQAPGTVQRNTGHVSAQAPAPAPATGPIVQRALLVGQRDYTKEYKHHTEGLPSHRSEQVLDSLVKDVSQHFIRDVAPTFTPQERAAFVNESDRITWQLKKVIVGPKGLKGYHPVLKGEIGKHPDFGTKNHDIRVPDYTELARGLMGWVHSKEKRKTEKVAAKTIQEVGNVEEFLNVALRRISEFVHDVVIPEKKLTSRQTSVMAEELRSGLSHLESQPIKFGPDGLRHDKEKAGKVIGLYLKHFTDPKFDGTALRTYIVEKGGFLAMMKRPEDFSFRDKMIGLHDLADYFGHSRHVPPVMGHAAVDEIDDRDKRSTAGYTHDGERITVQDRGQGIHPSTRDERSPTTKLARSRNLPVWAGQSYTAARMFKLAEASGASKEEIAAIGWGIFSFWRVNFDHTTDFAYHTLHEIMDIGQNFGVPYDIDDQYASLPLVTVDRINDKVRQVFDSTTEVYNDVRHQIAEMNAWIDSHPDVMDIRVEERFLEDAQNIARELKGIRANLNDTLVKFMEWSDLAPRDRTLLLRGGVDNLKQVRRRVKQLSHETANLQEI